MQGVRPGDEPVSPFRLRDGTVTTPVDVAMTDDPATPAREEPDPNRTGMPKCPHCGDIAYRPEPVGTRQQAWRCGGCHRTLSRCTCPATPAREETLRQIIHEAMRHDEVRPCDGECERMARRILAASVPPRPDDALPLTAAQLEVMGIRWRDYDDEVWISLDDLNETALLASLTPATAVREAGLTEAKERGWLKHTNGCSWEFRNEDGSKTCDCGLLARLAEQPEAGA